MDFRGKAGEITVNLAAPYNGDNFQAISCLNFRLVPKLAMQNFTVILDRYQPRVHAQLLQQLGKEHMRRTFMPFAVDVQTNHRSNT